MKWLVLVAVAGFACLPGGAFSADLDYPKCVEMLHGVIKERGVLTDMLTDQGNSFPMPGSGPIAKAWATSGIATKEIAASMKIYTDALAAACEHLRQIEGPAN